MIGNGAGMTRSRNGRPPRRGLPTGRRTTYLTLTFWLILMAVAAPLALKLSEVQDNDSLAALPARAEAARAADRVAAAYPGSDALVAVAVYARDGGLTDADRAKVEADRQVFGRYAPGGTVPAATPSGDGAAMLLSFPLVGDNEQQNAAAGEIKDRLGAGNPDGLTTGLTGSAGGFNDVLEAFEGLDSTLLLVSAGVVILVLLLTYRSPVLWVVPLLAIGVASQVASAAIYLLARYAGLPVDLQSQSILTVLLFGVGVDYALLLIARYREELRRHTDRYEAMALALRRSYPAIVASAATVAAGLLCLLAADMPGTRGLGPVAAVGVLTALAVMTTLLPALLVLCGRWLFWPFVPRFRPDAVGHDPAADHRGWARLAGVVGRRPRTTWIGTAVALGALVFGLGNLTLGLPSSENFTSEVGSVTGQRLIERHYPGGASAPADIIVAPGAADAVVAAARTVPGVAEVRPVEVSSDGRWARVAAVLTAEPESDTAKDTVERLRGAVHRIPGADALVGGDAAVALDTDRATARDNRVVMPLILVVVFVILVVLLRALVAPLLLLASVVLSYFAALGAAGLVLDAMGYPRLWVALPLQAFLFLVALGVDYTIFLMTRAREEAGTMGHRPGVLHALTVTGGVITSAGLVLAATFAALGVLPLVPSVQLGVIVAVGVLLDTLLVRSLLVPALALDIGPCIWWPSRLADGAAGPPASPARSTRDMPPTDVSAAVAR